MSINKDQLIKFVGKNIQEFHDKRLESLQNLKLKKILRRKNPYLFRAKDINTSEGLVRTILDAHLSSQEETLFGGFMGKLAIFICEKNFSGWKEICC